MGQYPITAGVFGKAMSATGIVGTPNGKPAWVFENQSGDLGNLLNSSTIWYDALTATDASINVIPAGTSKGVVPLGLNTDITVLNAGTNYTAGTTLTTLDSNPRSGQGLTVQVTVTAGGVVASVTVIAGGSGYHAGDIITIEENGRPGGSVDATFQLKKVDRGIPTADESVEFKVQGCGVLPIAVDYITSVNNITATELVICK
tara:strand:- start:29 stop:637 length:609 start_codon:yes stop_codon:yes gene_type:complete